MEELTTKFNESEPNITLTFNYGSSGDLQKQIENGAETNVFISAAQKQMNALESEDDRYLEPPDLVENKLVPDCSEGFDHRHIDRQPDQR